MNSLVPRDIREQVDALVTEFQLVVPDHILDGIISPRNPRDIVYGKPQIDVENIIAEMELSRHTVNDQQIVRLVKYLHGMNQKKIGEFLRFVTGSSVSPLGSFDLLEPRMEIAVSSNPEFLPSASTCFNMLFLPRYSSEQQLIAKL